MCHAGPTTQACPCLAPSGFRKIKPDDSVGSHYRSSRSADRITHGSRAGGADQRRAMPRRVGARTGKQMSRRRVVILYKYIPQYRVAFFTRLHEICRHRDVDLVIIHGDPGKADSLKGHSAKLDFATHVPNRFISVAGTELIWQPVLSHLGGADLVIVEQANKLLVNYALIAGQILGLRKFAFWGHGRDLQAANRD